MCGAIAWPYDIRYHHLYQEFFSEEQIRVFEREGQIVCAFWDPVPLLPVWIGQTLRLYHWGNRDKQLALPKTGWARLESLRAHKWDHLHPRVVLIPAARGCEKGVWFSLPCEIRAVLLPDSKRVYMITEPASEEYADLTGHGRMPRLHTYSGVPPFRREGDGDEQSQEEGDRDAAGDRTVRKAHGRGQEY